MQYKCSVRRGGGGFLQGKKVCKVVSVNEVYEVYYVCEVCEVGRTRTKDQAGRTWERWFSCWVQG